MSAGGSEQTADKALEQEGRSQTPRGSSLPAVELPKKRKGDVEERSDARAPQRLDDPMEDDFSRSEGEDQQVKMKCFREPHRQIEKRRRDKMNTLIDKLSAMIPACQPMSRKLDKITVLRKAVHYLKTLRAGTSRTITDTTYMPSILPHDNLGHLLLSAADSFLLVVSCDRAKILFTSESVSKILNFNKLELTGQSLFDFIHHKDINKVKEQLSSSDLFQPPLDDEMEEEAPVMPSLMSAGSRRSFFCRMKHSRVARKHGDEQPTPTTSKKKDSSRYCTLHCTGYMRSWPSTQIDPEGDTETLTSFVTCLVMVCRLHSHTPHHLPKDIQVKPTEFMTRCAIDGKFTFVDQQATTVIGYLPQEMIGTSCYEYFHQDDLQHLAEKHRQVLRSKEKIDTDCYRFKTKNGSYVSLQSQWCSFTNPWTKEVEFIVSANRVISIEWSSCTSTGHSHTKDDEVAGCSKAAQEDTKQVPIIPGLTRSLGTMIYTGSIGSQIASELGDYHRMNSPSSSASSPFCPVQEKCPVVSSQCSRSPSSREDTAGSSSQFLSDSRTTAGTSTDESSQLPDLEMVMPGASSYTSDETSMAVIMSLLESDVNMSQSGDFDDIHWPF